MEEKTEKIIIEKLNDLFMKDLNELCEHKYFEFHKKNNRLPTDEEGAKIIKETEEELVKFFNENPKNFKWVKKS